MAITLGAQLYTVRDFMKTPDMIEKTFRRIKDMGFRTIQISGIGPIDPKDLAALVKELDLYVSITHSPLERMQHDLDALIEEHKMIGCDTIGLGAMPEMYRADAAAARQFVKDITPIAHAIHEAGLHFSYHNHSFEFRRFDGKTIMDILFEETVPEEFFFTLDTYWLQYGGVSPADTILRAKDRAKVVHFKDYAFDKEPYYTEVGNGNLDLVACYRACKAANVKDIVIEQDVCPGDPFESLAVSFANLKKIAAAGEQ